MTVVHSVEQPPHPDGQNEHIVAGREELWITGATVGDARYQLVPGLILVTGTRDVQLVLKVTAHYTQQPAISRFHSAILFPFSFLSVQEVDGPIQVLAGGGWDIDAVVVNVWWCNHAQSQQRR